MDGEDGGGFICLVLRMCGLTAGSSSTCIDKYKYFPTSNLMSKLVSLKFVKAAYTFQLRAELDSMNSRPLLHLNTRGCLLPWNLARLPTPTWTSATATTATTAQKRWGSQVPTASTTIGEIKYKCVGLDTDKIVKILQEEAITCKHVI